MSDSDDIRSRAISNLKAKQAFWYSVAGWIALSIVMTLIWLLSGMGYFWPVWVIAATAIGLIYSAINAFGPGRGAPSESKIQREMKRLQ